MNHCKHCKAHFKPRKSGGEVQRFCSRKCQLTNYVEQRRIKYRGEKWVQQPNGIWMRPPQKDLNEN